MKLNTVHVDIVSEEKNFMGIMSWRQFSYCAVSSIFVYNLAKSWLASEFSFDNVVLVTLVLICPGILFVYLMAFHHLDEQDMFFDKFLWYWVIGKKEKGIYRYKEEGDAN